MNEPEKNNGQSGNNKEERPANIPLGAIVPKVIAEFPKCPICGSEKGIFQGIIRELKDVGKLPKEYPEFLQLQAQITGVLNPNLLLVRQKLPIVMMLYDICENGHMWYKSVLQMDAIAERQPVQIPPQQKAPAQHHGFR